jgi:hypothetical protein
MRHIYGKEGAEQDRHAKRFACTTPSGAGAGKGKC